MQAIRERLAKATPGPWRWDFAPEQYHIELRSPGFTIMGFLRWGMRAAAPAFLNDRWRLDRPHEGLWPHPDAELIANAPADLEFLLGEVGQVKFLRDTVATQNDLLAGSAAEIERLSAALAWRDDLQECPACGLVFAGPIGAACPVCAATERAESHEAQWGIACQEIMTLRSALERIVADYAHGNRGSEPEARWIGWARVALADRTAAVRAGEIATLRGVLRGLLEARKAHDDADTVAMRATFNDAPDAADCLDAMDATSRALDDAWQAVAKELGETAEATT